METKQRGRGRPPKDPAYVKSEVVRIKVSQEEKAAIESAGLSHSDGFTGWAREVLLRAAKRAKK